MSGVLYVVATPIGNLDDITHRAVTTLRQVDWIVAEDTRHSQRLLKHLDIHQKMHSLHQHNESQKLHALLGLLQTGSDIALISDAGTPLISDPGYLLVRAVRAAGLNVSPIPGPSSIIAALSVAGLPPEPFTFFGFLSPKNGERLQALECIKKQAGTAVLFEASHRITRLMEQMVQIMPENRLVIAKELTKLHENFLAGSAEEILARLNQDPRLRRGEFVVLIDNPVQQRSSVIDATEIDMLKTLMQEVSVKKAVELTCQFSGKKKNDVYSLALAMTQAKSDA